MSFDTALKTFSDALFDLEEAHVAAHTAEGAADICNGYAREAQEWVNWLERLQVEWGTTNRIAEERQSPRI